MLFEIKPFAFHKKIAEKTMYNIKKTTLKFEFYHSIDKRWRTRFSYFVRNGWWFRSIQDSWIAKKNRSDFFCAFNGQTQLKLIDNMYNVILTWSVNYEFLTWNTGNLTGNSLANLRVKEAILDPTLTLTSLRFSLYTTDVVKSYQYCLHKEY